MSLLLIIVLLLLVIALAVAFFISLKKKTVKPVIIIVFIILFGYLGLSSPYCHDSSNSFVEDDPMLKLVLSKKETVGNFIWSAPRWKVEGNQVTSCNAVYEVLLLGTFGR